MRERVGKMRYNPLCKIPISVIPAHAGISKHATMQPFLYLVVLPWSHHAASPSWKQSKQCGLLQASPYAGGGVNRTYLDDLCSAAIPTCDGFSRTSRLGSSGDSPWTRSERFRQRG